MSQWFAVIGSVLAIIIGVWRKFGRINREKRALADKAKEDMENAKKKDGTASDFLDSFGHLPK